MSYIARPTAVLKEYLQVHEVPKGLKEFDLGRLAMALEILTVIKTLEDELVPMLSLQREETISILTTILRDQELAEIADAVYQKLSDWRQPVFVPTDAQREFFETGRVHRAVPVSRLEALREAVALHESTLSPPGTDQSQALPSGESEQELPSEA